MKVTINKNYNIIDTFNLGGVKWDKCEAGCFCAEIDSNKLSELKKEYVDEKFITEEKKVVKKAPVKKAPVKRTAKKKVVK